MQLHSKAWWGSFKPFTTGFEPAWNHTSTPPRNSMQHEYKTENTNSAPGGAASVSAGGESGANFRGGDAASKLVCDGKHDDTAALQAQLDAGQLTLPAGATCLSQPLQITRSNTTISLPAGSTLKAGAKWTSGDAFITADHVGNITIVGRQGGGGGTIDGSGAQWWTGSNKTPNRPKLIDFDNVAGVLFDGFAMLNAASFHTMLRGQNYVIRHVSINSPDYRRAPNTDGFDIAATNVHIHDCNVTNGDDSIVMKSPAQNVLVERCIVKQGNGLVVGTSDDALFRNITFRNCTAAGTLFGCHIKFKDDQRGSASGITFEDIVIDGVTKYAIGINQLGQSVRQLQSNVTVNNIVFKNVRGTVAGFAYHNMTVVPGSAGQFLCSPGKLACRNITVEDVAIDAKFGCHYTNVYGDGANNSPASCTPPAQP